MACAFMGENPIHIVREHFASFAEAAIARIQCAKIPKMMQSAR